jgi:transcriptional regulator with XRE-family HTH domain
LDRLRQIRDQAGYSQQELADESGVSQHTISEIELGRRKPQGRTLRKLADALGVEVADFFPKEPGLLEALTVRGQPVPTLDVGDLPEEAQSQLAKRGFSSYFVPLEEGEEEDKVNLRVYYVRLFEGGEPILQAVREASPEEAAKIRQQREKAGRSRE